MGESDSKDDRSLPFSSGGERGIFFWKKRCLYVVMVMLVSTVTINLTLVCWLITILNLNTHGMSYIQSFGGGVQFTAKTYVQNLLMTSGLKTVEGQPLALRSVENLTLRTTDRFGYPISSIYLGGSTLDISSSNFTVSDPRERQLFIVDEDSVIFTTYTREGILDISSPNFTVSDPRGKTLFSVDEDSVSLAAHSLAISGEGGAVLEGSLLTPVVSADVRSNLVLESAMKGVQVVTSVGISIESRAGDIQVSSHHDITLQTVDGSIKLESANVLLSGLRRVHHHKHSHRSDKIYQLCVCDNGQLFLGEADAFCDSEGTNLELCR